MNALLLRLYPPAWRARYGAELESLILETSGHRPSWRIGADVAAGGLRERLRAAGLTGDAPRPERVRGGSLLVLCAWAVFVVAGVGVQKFSEHWQAGTPRAAQALPAHAFDALGVAAAVGSALVLIGIAVALPALLRFLRDGGWPLIRRRIVVAVALTLVAVGALAGLVSYAHGLGEAQRNGSDSAYTGVGAVVGLLLLACLAAWTVAAVACARRLHLSHRSLQRERTLATLVTVLMAAMTAATAVWWGALAHSARLGFFGGSVYPPQLMGAGALMVAATAAGAFGSRQALRR